MLKILLIVFVIGYIVIKGSGLILKLLFGAPQRSGSQGFDDSYRQKRPTSGNVNVNYDPRVKSQKNKQSFKGGEYVDFEEVD